MVLELAVLVFLLGFFEDEVQAAWRWWLEKLR